MAPTIPPRLFIASPVAAAGGKHPVSTLPEHYPRPLADGAGMNDRQIDRTLAVWLAFPAAATGTLSGVLSYSSEAEGVRFHSYGELMALLQRLATVPATVNDETSASVLRLAS
jgi:hypothetical protein